MSILKKVLPADIAGRLTLRAVLGGRAAAALPLFFAPALAVWGLYAANHQSEALEALRGRLETINAFKISRVSAWVEDRTREANRLSRHPIFGGLLAEELAAPGRHRRELETWLRQHLLQKEYVSLAFLSPSGAKIAATPGYVAANEKFFMDSFRAAAGDCRPALTDIYTSVSGKPRAAMLVPMSRGGGCAGGTAGVLVLNIDPAVKLFPALAEEDALPAGLSSFLLRRENGDAVLLNAGPATLPLSGPGRAAAEALRGNYGFGEALGFDGQKVYAVAGPVPGTAWVVSSEIRKGDALRQSRSHEYLALLAALFLATLAYGVFAAVLRARDERAERQVREADRRMAALLSTLPGCAYRCLNDPDWTPVFLSPGFEDITGYPPEEFIREGLSFGEMIVPEDRERVWKTVQEALAGDGRLSVTYTIKTRDGIRRTVFSQAVVAKDAGGATAAFDGYLGDITPLKKAEEALRVSEAKFRDTVELAVDGILMGSANGLIIGANSQMEKLSGRTRAELVGHHVGELFSPEEAKARPLRFDLLDAGQQVVLERNLLRPDGTALPVEMHSRRMPDGSYQTFYRDISERRRSEAALKASEEKFRQLTEKSTVGIFIIQDGRFVYVNPATEAMFGYSRDEVVGKLGPEALIHRDDLELMQARVAERLAGVAQKEDVVYRGIKKDGSRIFIDVSSIPIEHQGRPALMGTAADITRRREAEEALQASEQKLKYTIDEAPVCVAMLDLDRRFLECNKAFSDFTGYSAEEMRGRSIQDITHPEDAKSGMAELREILAGARQTATVQKRYVRKDGAVVWGEVNIKLIRDARGRPLHLLPIIQDITARRKAEEESAELDAALRESEAIFAGFMEHSPVYVFFKDEEFRPVRMSRNFERLLGRPLEEALGRRMEEIFPPEAAAEMLARDRRVFESGAEEVVEQRFGGGVFHTVEFPIDLGDRRYLAGFAIDITGRKAAEEEAQKLNASLAEKTREMESVLYITTHDLRGPLVNIQGFSSGLEKHFGELRAALKAKPGAGAEQALAKVPEALGFIQDSAVRMDNILRSLLKVSRLGRMEMRPEVIDMDRIAAKVIDSMRFRLQECGGEIAAGQLPRCTADPSAADQVLGNLLDNALKYRRKDVPLRVAVSGEVRGGKAVYAVADNGRGIAARDLPRVWDVFFRCRGTDAPGEGIGLTMTRRLVEKNGGRLWAESKEGEGTTFFVELPAEGEA